MTPMLIVELVAVAFAVAYLVLAIRQNIWCWPAALVSVALSLVLFYDANLLMESALQIFYFAMGVYGWRQWRHGSGNGEGISVHWWNRSRHVVAIIAILILSALFGFLLRGTDAAMPFVDSFTTVGAMVATYMVARKIIENWIYWFVIDAVSIFLYLDRGLVLYAALFAVYLVLIIVGFRAWLADWREAGLISA
jgi:nicotinamide mononucleotide transporter